MNKDPNLRSKFDKIKTKQNIQDHDWAYPKYFKNSSKESGRIKWYDFEA